MLVTATSKGRTALAAARPAHARAVRRALLERTPAPGFDAFWDAIGQIAAPPAPGA